jgi:acyl-CoA dehydrogenase
VSPVSTALTREQSDLRQTVADLMAKRSPQDEVRRLMATDAAYDPGVWAELAALGLLGLIIPEEFGGSGAGAAELAVVAEQMGRALLCAPYLSAAVLTPYLLLALEDPAECAQVLPQIAAGELTTAVAFAETGSARPPRHPATTAVRTANGWSLTGEKTYVLDGVGAHRFYVHADFDSGAGIFAVTRGADGLTVTPLSGVDQTRRQARITLVDSPARLIGTVGSGTTAVDNALDRAAVALIAEQAGGAMHCTELASEYARTRYQFGRAIGSFQAIKHLCVDMLLESQSACSAARHVAAAFDAAEPDRLTDLALAQAYCSDAFCTVAAATIQVHGGIGFTWEHPAHLYLRRARTDNQIFGDPAWHRERYIRLREES